MTFARFAITLAAFGLLAANVLTAAERCAQRIERRQLQRAALLASFEQGAK